MSDSRKPNREGMTKLEKFFAIMGFILVAPLAIAIIGVLVAIIVGLNNGMIESFINHDYDIASTILVLAIDGCICLGITCIIGKK